MKRRINSLAPFVLSEICLYLCGFLSPPAPIKASRPKPPQGTIFGHSAHGGCGIWAGAWIRISKQICRFTRRSPARSRSEVRTGLPAGRSGRSAASPRSALPASATLAPRPLYRSSSPAPSLAAHAVAGKGVGVSGEPGCAGHPRQRRNFYLNFRWPLFSSKREHRACGVRFPASRRRPIAFRIG